LSILDQLEEQRKIYLQKEARQVWLALTQQTHCSTQDQDDEIKTLINQGTIFTYQHPESAGELFYHTMICKEL